MALYSLIEINITANYESFEEKVVADGYFIRVIVEDSGLWDGELNRFA